MSNTKYSGVTRLPPHVSCTRDKGKSYYYFRRRGFPIVRLPGEPGSELFTTVYNSALTATSREQFTALRSKMERQRPDIPLSPLEITTMAWAERKPITLAQATMVAELLCVAIEDVVRGRAVTDDPKNEALANLKV